MKAWFASIWKVMNRASDRIIQVIATLVFAFIYIVVLPIFWFLQKKHPVMPQTNWHIWPFRSDTMDEIRKQF